MRLFALALAWAWSITASSFGLNSLIKSNQGKAHIKAAALPGVTVDINTDGGLSYCLLSIVCRS